MHLGIPAERFWTLCKYELSIAFYAAHKKSEDDHQWDKYKLEAQRLFAVWNINMQLRSEDRLKDPRQLITFGWEEPDKQNEPINIDEVDLAYHFNQ